MFLFSFYKDPKVIVNKIFRIQITILQCGRKYSKKVIWIRWDYIYLSKEECGLRVKHCGMFNHTLLSKWTWRILNNDSHLWFELFYYRYGNVKRLVLGRPCLTRNDYLGWKGLYVIREPKANSCHINWFLSSFLVSSVMGGLQIF